MVMVLIYKDTRASHSPYFGGGGGAHACGTGRHHGQGGGLCGSIDVADERKWAVWAAGRIRRSVNLQQYAVKLLLKLLHCGIQLGLMFSYIVI